MRVQRDALRLVAPGCTQRPSTRRPATNRLMRNVTVAASDRVSETRVPTRADSAGPERAARNRAGESRNRETVGATRSLPGAAGGGGSPTTVSPTGSKAAATERLSLIVTVHGPLPEQAPLQPAKLEPAAGVAASVTEVPSA